MRLWKGSGWQWGGESLTPASSLAFSSISSSEERAHTRVMRMPVFRCFSSLLYSLVVPRKAATNNWTRELELTDSLRSFMKTLSQASCSFLFFAVQPTTTPCLDFQRTVETSKLRQPLTTDSVAKENYTASCRDRCYLDIYLNDVHIPL